MLWPASTAHVTDTVFGDFLEAYASAFGHREITCVQSLPRLPRWPLTLCGSGTYQPTRGKTLKASQVLPGNDQIYPPNRPINSIFLSMARRPPRTKHFRNPGNSTEVTGIMDWQSVGLGPLFEHASAIFSGLQRPVHSRA